MRYLKELTILIAALLLAGCPSTQTIPDPEPQDTTYDDGGVPAGDVGGDAWGDGRTVPGDDMMEGPSTVIYFEFDSSDIRSEDAETVRRHAMQLAGNSNLRVLLEGHADERGSREYNIGLGERRAQSVRRALMFQGASASQIRTVSFGEERPAAAGSSESAYSQNRRVEIRYE